MSSEAFRASPLNSSPPLPPPPPPQIASFPILFISVAGILATSILLLTCYVFVIKCSLNEHHSRRRRWGHGHSASLSPAADQLGGVAESTIREIPTLRYRQLSVGAAECAVCLSEFREQERIRLLPSCRHVFHIDCIDTWLQSNSNCPLCRGSISAPISLHPLSMASVLQLGHPHDVVLQIRDEEDRNIEFSGSRGDECIDVGKKEEEKLRLQPMRRSFSADSSGNRQLHVTLQRILQKSSHEGSSFGSGRSR
ncbi:RING-H2 finger protein ATL1-like [Curcuma longa]|uniref:RING-H2 finger protein ATL1-like n=1 Tax=Curcuma longa TaxID=136217 RepID=UPI003D9DCA9F